MILFLRILIVAAATIFTILIILFGIWMVNGAKVYDKNGNVIEDDPDDFSDLQTSASVPPVKESLSLPDYPREKVILAPPPACFYSKVRNFEIMDYGQGSGFDYSDSSEGGIIGTDFA